MSTFDKLADLPLEIDSTRSSGSSSGSSGFTRVTTAIRLRGGGEEGIGEDVTYDALDHIALQDARPGARRCAGTGRSASFCDLVGALDLFPAAEPVRERVRLYRRWAFESAALDLALRQAGISLARRSSASRGPSRSSSRCGSASRRRSSRSHAGSSAIPTCASSSTRRTRGPTS